jgi:pantetheine-phosphate adenylyltransferase
MLIGVYPGTFDPATYGHIDIIKNAASFCDKLLVAVANDSSKKVMFSASERVEILNDYCGKIKGVEVVAFSGLLVDFVAKSDAKLIIRGLRAVSDFEYEFQLSHMNSRLAPSIQTILLPASENNQFLASSIVKEIARLGGDVSGFVSPLAVKKLTTSINP